jgi:chemotaxis family two-component system response regulator Rcp1
VEILLVEDEPASVRLVQEALKGSRVALHLNVAHDGEQALAIVRREGPFAAATAPDLILLDLHLPKMDGFAVLNELKQDAAFRCIPVIVLTTSSTTADIQHCYALGANAYVVKPRSLAQVLTVISSIADFWCAAAKLPYCDTEDAEMADQFGHLVDGSAHPLR